MSKKEFYAIAFDTETTGLLKPEIVEVSKQPQIIEYYGAKLIHKSNGEIEIVDELESFLLPAEPISAEITKITGIEQSMLKGAPSFAEFMPKLIEFHLGTERWIAHNLAFDSNMIFNELKRIGWEKKFPFPYDHCCTVQKSLFIEQRRMTLTNLHKELFGEEFPDAHRAKSDVLPMIRCYKELVKMGKIYA